MYEIYAQAAALGEDFAIRVTRDRFTKTNDKLLGQIHGTKATGQVTVNIQRNSRANIPARQAEVEIEYCIMKIKKQNNVMDRALPDLLKLDLYRLSTTTLQDFYIQYIEPSAYIFELENGDTINLIFSKESFCHLIDFSRFGYDGMLGWEKLS